MKKNHINLMLIILVFLLSACSSTTQNKKIAENEQLVVNNEIPYSETIECINDFHSLEKLNKKEYLTLSEHYIYITNEFQFLKANEKIIDLDSKNYLRYKLNIKISALCNKVKYFSFIAIKEKTESIKI